MTTDPACEFCEIVARSAPARIVFEDEDSLAFFPLNPASPGHTLVIPRVHIPDIWSLSRDQASPLLDTTLKVSRAIRTALRPDGLNIINSNGAAATQTIFHIHVHLVPRWHSDHFGNIWPPSSQRTDDTGDDVAEAIRQAIESG
ncbi:HIT domain-containing protein [Dactylosporangium sp. NPDC006015]|uniref:HIT family protein n=1 Tax=Dactylosporangium sp. NPDC006015 TaxID=3154576 RepID=UPI0033A30410